jgi:hypothetical protein
VSVFTVRSASCFAPYRRTPGQVIAVLESLPERSSLHIRRTLIEEVIAALR